MGRSRIRDRGVWFALAVIALLAGGCAQSSCFRIDPTGEHLFARNLPPPPVDNAVIPASATCPPVAAAPAKKHHHHKPHYKAEPNPALSKLYDTNVELTPRRVIAPVNSEVVLRASVTGPHGHLKSLERVEWSMAPGGVGQFMGVGQPGGLDWLFGDRPKKLTNTYVVNKTSAGNVKLNRGSDTCDDDVTVQRGQAWITVSSPFEGVSHVTALVPKVAAWDSRQQSAVVYWIDADWVLPPAAVNPAGTKHIFTTTIVRHTNRCPVSGWRVRYEIVDGPSAGFSPDGSSTIEVATDGLGQARAEIFQYKPAAGTNTINIQIIRPADQIGGDGTRLVVGTGSTTKTWGSPDFVLNTSAPAQGAVGSTLSYKIELRNNGSRPIKEIVATDQVPPGLTFVGSDPPPSSTSATVVRRPGDPVGADSPAGPGVAQGNTPAAGPTLLWRLGDLAPGEARTLSVDFRAELAGSVTNCVSVQTASGHAGQDCATTTVTAPSIAVEVTGPSQAVVGTEATFVATITNRGASTATGLVIVDRFDPGLRHSVSASPIERDLGDLQPGQSRNITVKFQVVAPGQQCNSVEVASQAGVLARGNACLLALAPAAPPAAPPITPSPVITPTPAPSTPTGPKPTISVRKTGPTQRNVGENAEFVIEISNPGTVQANMLKIADNYDLALDPVAATDGHSFVGDDLVWIVDMLPPGKTIRFQINCKCLARSDKACNRVTVTSQEGARADAEACLAIAAPATPLTLAATDLRDPVTVGAETTYEIQVQNGNQATDRDVELSVTLPPQLTPSPVGTSGPAASTIQGQMIYFAPVAELPAGATLTYRVLAKGALPGAAQVNVQVSSANMPQPIGTQVSTTVLAPQ